MLCDGYKANGTIFETHNSKVQTIKTEAPIGVSVFVTYYSLIIFPIITYLALLNSYEQVDSVIILSSCVIFAEDVKVDFDTICAMVFSVGIV